MVRDSFVVTDTVLYPAKGMIFRFKLYTCSKIQHYSVFYRKCSTVECQGELHYDAQSQSCLLDMGIFLWCMRYFGDNYIITLLEGLFVLHAYLVLAQILRRISLT